MAVEYARRIFDSFNDKTLLCIGAGKMGALVLQGFAALGPGKMLIANRDRQTIPVTLSLGVASWPDTPADAAVDLLQAADQALYRAKAAGRNQISI